MNDIQERAADLAARADGGDGDAENTLKEMVEDVLNGLGADADEVAATLATNNTRGRRNDRKRNPISRYLMATLGACDASVDEVSAVACFTLSDDAEWSVEDIDFPEACEEFIQGFDDEGRYPHLVGN